MNSHRPDALDEALSKLPKSVPTERDLWPRIQAQIEAERPGKDARRGFTPRWYQLAAGVLLVLASSVTTFVIMRDAQERAPAVATTELPRPEIAAMPASFAGYRLGEDYTKARAQLDLEFEQRLALLPPEAREKVERNLADIRAAAREIADTLAEHPTDPLLHELLMSTYQSELQLLAHVTQMAPATTKRVQL
ncbi:MAG: hypothetical protein GX535_03350 [Xanthomonadaceae bacterium]|nr:hypothetical protein [Xanthomonadaceae bacterium]